MTEDSINTIYNFHVWKKTHVKIHYIIGIPYYICVIISYVLCQIGKVYSTIKF